MLNVILIFGLWLNVGTGFFLIAKMEPFFGKRPRNAVSQEEQGLVWDHAQLYQMK